MADDTVNPFFCTDPLYIEALTEVFFTPVSAHEADLDGHATLTVLARHAGRTGMTSLQALADLWLQIADNVSPGWSEIARIDSPPSQEAMARLIGKSTVHLNRTIKQLKAAGLVSIGSHQVSLFNRALLASIALGASPKASVQ